MYQRNPYAYIPGEAPRNLLDTSNFTLDFNFRKFVHIGIDHTQSFEVSVNISSLHRFVNMSCEFLERFYSVMEDILGVMLNTENTRDVLFLQNDYIRIYKSMCGKDAVLVIESKLNFTHRVLFSRNDIVKLQYLKGAVFECINQKLTVTRFVMIDQFEKLVMHVFTEYPTSDAALCIDELRMFISEIEEDIIINKLHDKRYIFVNQIKLLANKRIAQRCVEIWNCEFIKKNRHRSKSSRKINKNRCILM